MTCFFCLWLCWQYYHNTNCIRRGAGGSSCSSTERNHMQKGKPVSYWFRITSTSIIFGGGDDVDSNEFTRTEFSYMRNNYSLDRNFRIDQFTVSSGGSGMTTFSNIKVRSGSAGDANDKDVAPPRCTFLKTGTNYQMQQWYYCDTCGMDDNSNQGVCEPCKESCHKGHALREGRNSLFYCDCGSVRGESCQINKPIAKAASAASSASSSSSGDAQGYKYYLLRVIRVRGEGSTMYIRRPRWLVGRYEAQAVNATVEKGSLQTDCRYAIDGSSDYGVELSAGSANIVFAFPRTTPISTYELVTSDTSSSYDPADWELYGSNNTEAVAGADHDDRRNWTLLDTVRGFSATDSRKAGFGVRPLKSAAERERERASAEALRGVVPVPRGFALYNTGSRTVSRDADGLEAAAEAFLRGDKVVLSITPSKGLVTLSKNGCSQGTLFSDPSVFARPQRLAVSLYSPDAGNLTAHVLSAALVDAPSLFLRDFNAYLDYQGKKAAGAAVSVPAELSVAPLLLDDEEVAAFAAAEAVKPSFSLIRQAMPKKSYLKIKKMLETDHTIDVRFSVAFFFLVGLES